MSQIKRWEFLNFTGPIVSVGPHPAKFFTITDHVAQITVTEHAGVQSEQGAIAVNRRDVQTDRVTENDVYSSGLHVSGTMQAVGHRIRATAGYNADGQNRAGKSDVGIVGIDLLVLDCSQNQSVEHLGERAVAADAHYCLKCAKKVVRISE